jgi:hypothetical protein
MTVLKFKKKEKIGIIQHGTVTITSDGKILAENFSFHGVDMFAGMELARAWALNALRKA